MIYEVRTYRLQPRGVPKFMEIFGEAYENRKRLSPLSAFFYTEIGPLNQVIHIWPYDDANDREEKRKQSEDTQYSWPPKVSHLIEHMQTEIFMPAPFSPEFASGSKGPIFEWREYMMIPGRIPETYEAWQKALPERLKMSELVMAMHTEAGDLNKFVHIWAYESLEHRASVRGEAAAKGIWPPKGSRETLQTQTNKIVLAAPFSPLR